MASAAEALGMSLLAARHRRRPTAGATGLRVAAGQAVELLRRGITARDILTK